MKHFYRNYVCFTSTDSFGSFLPRLQKKLLGQRAGGFDQSSLVHLTKGSLSNLIFKRNKVTIYLPMINNEAVFPAKKRDKNLLLQLFENVINVLLGDH